MPKSGLVVLANRTAPASRTRAAGGASSVCGVRSPAAVPIGFGTPFVAINSLTVTPIPSIGLSGAPASHRASAARAALRRTAAVDRPARGKERLSRVDPHEYAVVQALTGDSSLRAK
jgi:hypothetical protein